MNVRRGRVKYPHCGGHYAKNGLMVVPRSRAGVVPPLFSGFDAGIDNKKRFSMGSVILTPWGSLCFFVGFMSFYYLVWGVFLWVVGGLFYFHTGDSLEIGFDGIYIVPAPRWDYYDTVLGEWAMIERDNPIVSPPPNPHAPLFDVWPHYVVLPIVALVALVSFWQCGGFN